MPSPLSIQLLGGSATLGLFAASLLALYWLCERAARAHAALPPAGVRAASCLRSGSRRLGPYTLANKIGEGAMGEVYRAWHGSLQRWCAIKLLPRNAPERERRRFEQEVQLTARLVHPNIVSVYEHGQASDGTAFYAMELLQGLSLQELVERHGAQPPGRVIQILLQVCAALSEAHGAGLIHRDIKPDNIVLAENAGRFDVATLIDFGLVKQLAGTADLADSPGALVGTPLYLSPEAITAPETSSPRSDLYGLGAVAYFLLSGVPVFSGKSLVEVCCKHLHSVPEPLSRLTDFEVGQDLERLVFECLAKDPQARPASAAELARKLSRCADAGTWSEADAKSWWQQQAARGSSSVAAADTALLSSSSPALSSTVMARRIRRPAAQCPEVPLNARCA
jgi:eukaryotic-like serine/threonine-protein kinase